MRTQIKKDLKAIAKDLEGLTQKTDKMIKQLKELDKAQAAKKPKPKAVRKAVTKKAVTKKAVTKKAVTRKAVTKKPTRMSASDTALAIIKRSKKGVDTAALKKKTGLKDTNIRTILYRLSKQGKIKGLGKGLYVKA